MDIALYGRVLWRHKLVVAMGVSLAIMVAVFSYVRIGTGGISYRQSQTWVSYETVAVTQPGFTEGRLNATGADPARLAVLAVLYSKYLDTDAVQHVIWPSDTRSDEIVEAAPVIASNGSAAGALPIISVAGFATRAAASQRLTARATSALIGYIKSRQAIAG